jgi:CubicO group peptidase (beta-lactamase class C family)
MRFFKHCSFFFCWWAAVAQPAQAQKKPQSGVVPSYFPPAREWAHKRPADLGLDSAKLQAAVALARASESKNPRSMEANHYRTFGREPFGFGIGPFADRGEATGLIIYRGYVVAAWGEPHRPDMAHSVTKSFLSAVVGLAVDGGLVGSVHDTVAHYVPPIEPYGQPAVRPAEEYGQPYLFQPFATAHNRRITWDHLLRQTSDWEGTLWGKPDWADRPSDQSSEWLTRPRQAPGSGYEYNDVRVNVLALAATSVWRRPLPEVLRERLMDPIGASTTWRWAGYRNAWIVLDGQAVQVVSGGGHWGGGLFISAYDLARFGLLTLHRGRWAGRQLLSEQWVRQSLTPTPAQPTYGYMNWFLNTDRKPLPSAPPTAFYHVGNGANLVYVDPDHELVVVVRWIEANALDGIVQRVLAALPTR